MQILRNRAAIALILMLALTVSLFSVPLVAAQTWSIYISVGSDWLVRGEVRLNNVRQQTNFTGITLAVMNPGSTTWRYFGPFSTTNGRVDYYFGDYPGSLTVNGNYSFQYIVPPQGSLPTNNATADGKWYSAIIQREYTRTPKTTYPYIGAIPNPIGKGEATLLHVGITDPIGLVGSGWTGLSIKIWRPDNQTETISDIATDSTGGTGRWYFPQIAGNYTLQTNFPEQLYRGVSYLASSSYLLTLVVTEEPVTRYPGHALPTEYWTRPIDPQLREWYTISGSWLVSSPENLFMDPGNDEAPDTAHILWTKPFTTGGLVGGDVGLESSANAGPVGFETGDAYQGKWGSRFIIAGKLIYTHHTSIRPLEYIAVDLRTGEEVWRKTFLDNRSISMCQTFYFQSYNYMGTYAYIWVTVGTTWYGFDPFDTTLRVTLTNVPSGTTIVGERGDIYRWSVSTSTRRMLLWNLSAAFSIAGSYLGPGPTTANASVPNAYALNITIPEGLPGSTQRVYLGDRVVGGSLSTTAVRVWGFSLEPGKEGQQLFNETWTPPKYWAEGNVSVSGFAGGWVGWSQEDYVAVMWIKETREHYGFSLKTGKYLWGPTESQNYMDSVEDSADDVRNIAYGNLYCASVSGIVYCYNVTTGKRQWVYEATDPYTEYMLGNTWWQKPVFICDGKIYVGHTEHSANQPLPRGGPFICLNATTGEEIWRINGAFRQTRWGGRAIIGDSIIATMDTYDQRVYAIGKGPSATTVTAGPEDSVRGSSVVVKGMVTDVSPGTKDSALTMRFPNGVPAVSDESMSDWMLHVYKQFERPADTVGVEVVVEVLDPNTNSYEVARTTSDANGFFSCTFTPEVPGKYTIIARFAGSGAYYGSLAETAINVEEAPAATPSPTPEPASFADMYFAPISIATIVAIVIIVILLVLLLFRKK